jgi:hypothetical protein
MFSSVDLIWSSGHPFSSLDLICGNAMIRASIRACASEALFLALRSDWAQ